MNKFKKPMITAAVLAGLALIGSLMNSRPSVLQAAGGPTVTIDPDQLPLHVTGSTTVAGTVAATQSGLWNMGVLGTPNVNVTNSATSPALVRDVDNAAVNPFSKLLCASDYPGSCLLETGQSLPISFTVPSVTSTGATVKRLMIQFISGNCVGLGRATEVTLSGRPGASALVIADTGDNFTNIQMPLAVAQYASAVGLNSAQSFASPTQIAWSPGTIVRISFNAAASGGSQCTAGLSGYFVTQ